MFVQVRQLALQHSTRISERRRWTRRPGIQEQRPISASSSERAAAIDQRGASATPTPAPLDVPGDQVFPAVKCLAERWWASTLVSPRLQPEAGLDGQRRSDFAQLPDLVRRPASDAVPPRHRRSAGSGPSALGLPGHAMVPGNNYPRAVFLVRDSPDGGTAGVLWAASEVIRLLHSAAIAVLSGRDRKRRRSSPGAPVKTAERVPHGAGRSGRAAPVAIAGAGSGFAPPPDAPGGRQSRSSARRRPGRAALS